MRFPNRFPKRGFGCGKMAVVGLALYAASGWAQPQGGDVVSGDATITQSENLTQIDQLSDTAVINWVSFSVGADGRVVFNTPGAHALTVNRVIGDLDGIEQSIIAGEITSNGRFALINPAGVLFQPGSTVDVAAIIATTSDITDEDAAAGRLVFAIPTEDLEAAIRVEEGASITVSEGGFAALVGPRVAHRGVIAAPLGKIELASGDAFTVDPHGDGLIKFALPAGRGADGDGPAVDVAGRIEADGGFVALTAQGVDRLIDGVAAPQSEVRANNAVIEGGVVRLFAGGGDVEVSQSVVEADDALTITAGGDAAVVGATLRADRVAITADRDEDGAGDAVLRETTIDVADLGAGGVGGTVEVTGARVAAVERTTIDARGATGGGTVRLGGEYKGGGDLRRAARTRMSADSTIAADAVETGDGGEVILWADQDTAFAGAISARGGAQGGDGGFVETSGAQHLRATGTVDASAPAGAAGKWLLDPTDVTIVDVDTPDADLVQAGTLWSPAGALATSEITDDTILASINLGTDVEIETTSAGGGNGDITLATDIIANVGGDGEATLTLTADRDILMTGGDEISDNSGLLNVNLNAGRAVEISGGTTIDVAGAITVTGGDNAVTDSVLIDGAATALTAGGAVTITGGDNAGADSVQINDSMVTATSGNVVLTGGANAGSDSIQIFGGATVTATAGAVTIAGGDDFVNRSVIINNADVQAAGDVTVTTGDDSAPSGTNLQIAGGSTIVSTAGSVALTGGDGALTDSVVITGGAVTAANTVAITGGADAGGDSVQIESATVTATSGNVGITGGSNAGSDSIQIFGGATVTATAGAVTIAGGDDFADRSVIFNNADVQAAGDVTVTTGDDSAPSGTNLQIAGGSTIVSTAGSVALTGADGASANSVQITGGAVTAANAVTITGGDDASGDSVQIESATVTATSGNVGITGGSNAGSDSIQIFGGATVTATAGAVTIAGGDEFADRSVIINNADVQAAGDVTVTTGDDSAPSGTNLQIAGGSTIVSTAGSVALTGGDGASANSVQIEGGVTMVTAANAVTIAGGADAGADSVFIDGAAVTANTGDILLTGGANAGGDSVQLSGNATVTATAGAATIAGGDDFTSLSVLISNADVQAAGDVTVTAGDDAAPSGTSLRVSVGATVESTAGSVALTGGDGAAGASVQILGGAVSVMAANAVTITGGDGAVGDSIEIANAAIDAAAGAITITGGDDAGDDSVFLDGAAITAAAGGVAITGGNDFGQGSVRITNGAQVTAADALAITGGDDTVATSTGNNIAIIQNSDVESTSGSVTITAGDNAATNSFLIQTNATVTAANDVTIAGGSGAGTDNVQIGGASTIAAGGAATFSGESVVLNGGGLTAGTTVTVDQTGTGALAVDGAMAGVLTGSGAADAIILRSATDIDLQAGITGTVAGRSLTLEAAGNIDVDQTIVNNGDVELAANTLGFPGPSPSTTNNGTLTLRRVGAPTFFVGDIGDNELTSAEVTIATGGAITDVAFVNSEGDVVFEDGVDALIPVPFTIVELAEEADTDVDVDVAQILIDPTDTSTSAIEPVISPAPIPPIETTLPSLPAPDVDLGEIGLVEDEDDIVAEGSATDGAIENGSREISGPYSTLVRQILELLQDARRALNTEIPRNAFRDKPTTVVEDAVVFQPRVEDSTLDERGQFRAIEVPAPIGRVQQ